MSGSHRFCFRGGEILVRRGGAAGHDTLALDSAGLRLDALGEPAERLTFADGSAAEAYPAGVDAPAGWEWLPFRGVIGALPEAEWLGAARAIAFVNWRTSTRFCGRCGAPNGDKADEQARQCPACGALSFPRLSPAVLAVVRKGDRILLARNAANKAGTWSILAGFVEPGETFEGCIRREVREEVSVEVEPGDYLGSQPWPFPDQLMVGFAAEWKSGELAPDGVEIAEAGWFGPDDHPPIPMHGSLSRRLIDAAFSGIEAAGTRQGPVPKNIRST
ncbi:MAG: NAD(+) diphosphatase [Spirochaetae bacterium HGW-Spirochaetae-7]|jgi:NAD+ diphosphatase|nr:MAG: NAD(+) diphosphatase [Spirochaetae bacterium HGW-Spirochaetae-7]